MDDSDLLIQAGFSTAKMEAETRKILVKYEEAAKRAAKKFDGAMAKASNNETLKATAREIDRLARKYDPAYAAARKYERGVKQLNRAIEIGAITNKEYEQGLENLVQDLERAGKSAGKLGASMHQGSGASRSYGGALQNVGFQVGDFATQVSAGTSVTQALGQQLPQLLGAFGAFGAGAGAAAAILIPLGAALYEAYSGAVDLEEQTKALTEATDAYVAIAEAAATPIETLREKYGDLADEMAAVNGQLATMLGAVAGLQLDQSFSSFANQFGGFSDNVDRRGRNAGPGGVSESEWQRTVSSVAGAYDVARSDAEAIVRALKNVNEAVGAEQRLDALREMLALFTRAAESSEQLADVFSADIARIQTLIESTSKQLEASLTEDERRRERIFAKYAERERELAKLIRDRGIAEREMRQASLDGNLAHIKTSRAVIAGIDEEIERLTDAQGRVTDLAAETEVLIEAFERVTFDRNNESYQQALRLSEAIDGASQNIGDLDDADLSNLEARLHFIQDDLEGLRGLAQGLNSDLSIAGENAASGYGRSRIQGETLRRNAVSGDAVEIIKRFEGFKATAYSDGNAYRAGFGSDTVTLADGSVRRITQGMRVSYGDANRDLLRRVGEFQDGIVSQIGRDRFSGFSEAQQASLTSLAYNYGSLPDRILPAIRGGTNQDIATAIAGLQGDNEGVNRNRRLQEASAFGNTALVQAEIQQQSEQQRLLEQEAKERARLLDIRTAYAEQMRAQIADAELENSLIGKSAEEQARLRAEYILTQDAKRRGINLNERIAGSEETYAEAIKRTAAELAEKAMILQELKSHQDQAEASARRVEQAQNALKQGLIDAIVEGKNFSDVMSNVANMLAKAALEAALFGNSGLFASAGLMGTGSGLLGGAIIPGILHSGGVAGSDGYGHGRAFSASTWAGATRYHSGGIAGLRPGEVPAILEKGELVLPTKGVLSAPSVGKSEGMTVNIHNAPAGEHQVRQSDDGRALDIIIERKAIEAVTGPRGQQALRNTFGLRPTVRGS
ncbi:MAG: glycoside hydrolase family protein [Mangrovicoccus sp.]